METYDPQSIESKWQKRWEEKKLFEVREDPKKKKFYGLIEFPYPSGAGLHVGHPRSYTAMDVICRKRRAQGENVLFPIGFDSFGLPTENYAIKTGRPPSDITEENIATFTRQLKALGLSFDWSRAVDTSDTVYYRWTQWIFLQLFKRGLAYKKKQAINWCPKDKIGLANEEVVNGCCERCGNPVEKREKEQWMLAITKYADSLLAGLKTVDYIPQAKTQQKHWIGKSDGLLFTAPVKGTKLTIQTFSAHFEAFFADTFVVIAPDHSFLPTLLDGVPEKQKILEECRRLIEQRQKRGFDEEKESEGIFTGRYIEDPVGNGDLPVWVASYALAEYGTGIVKCSAHDARDFAFAKKYGIRLKAVLFPSDPDARRRVELFEECFADMANGILSEPREFAGYRAGDIREQIKKYAIDSGFAETKIQYKLRDWVFSRQRYWGEPIPLVFCEHCRDLRTSEHTRNSEIDAMSEGEKLNPGWFPISESDLPLTLPKIEKYQPTDTGESPLAQISEWVNTTCPRCGGPAKRETDTMPNWAGSSWYFLRYADPKNVEQFASRSALKYWMPVDWYNGGMEHTVLHLLYSRFWNQFLFDIGVVPTKEPYQKRTSHGLILAHDGEKMSKSRGNVVNPDEIVREYGSDTLRTYILFMGPFDQPVAWDTNGLIGVRRFLDRVWNMREKVADMENESMHRFLQKTIKQVSDDIEAMRFNTAIAKLMELSRELSRESAISRLAYRTFLQLLAPFASHMSEELWERIGETDSISFAPWPSYDPSLIASERITLAIQVNGKLRDTIEVDADISEEDAKILAQKSEKVQKWIRGKELKRIVVVPNKLVNIVL